MASADAPARRAADEAAATASAGTGAFVFFDELNACTHVPLLVEVITHRSVHGRPIHPAVSVIAAINPYRLRPAREAANAGLVFQLDAGAAADPMAALVYRVHDVPLSLHQFVFDFGALTQEQEEQYTRALLGRRLAALERSAGLELHVALSGRPVDAPCALALLAASQEYVRRVEADVSSVSLRDVSRCCDLIGWFAEKIVPRRAAPTPAAAARRPQVSRVAAAVVLALTFVYYYRLPSARAQQEYWETLRATLVRAREAWTDGGRAREAWQAGGFSKLAEEGALERLLAQVQRRFVQNVVTERGIAMNAALTENVFVGVICVLNKLPLFIVGKPGTSKTLTLQARRAHRAPSSARPRYAPAAPRRR